jgi:hypothetical protein
LAARVTVAATATATAEPTSTQTVAIRLSWPGCIGDRSPCCDYNVSKIEIEARRWLRGAPRRSLCHAGAALLEKYIENNQMCAFFKARFSQSILFHALLENYSSVKTHFSAVLYMMAFLSNDWVKLHFSKKVYFFRGLFFMEQFLESVLFVTCHKKICFTLLQKCTFVTLFFL